MIYKGGYKLIKTATNKELTRLSGNGDFRSPECTEILKESDVVITNPPFSLFRDWLKQVLSRNKKFLVIANVNAITYRDVFPLFQHNKISLGYNSGTMEFEVPDSYPLFGSKTRRENNKNYILVKGIRWFTNLETCKNNQELVLTRKYNTVNNTYYDNYAAIEVGKVKDIPTDYPGVMGVPITFLDKYCPRQFEIVGIGNRWGTPELKTRIYTKEEFSNYSDLNAAPTIWKNSELVRTYARIFIRKK